MRFNPHEIIRVSESASATWPHRHDFLEIVYFKSGQGTHRVEDSLYEITNGNVGLINTGVEHYYQINANQKKELEVKNILFVPSLLGEYSSANFIDEIYTDLMHKPPEAHRNHIQISRDCNKDVFMLIELIEHELSLKEVGYLDVIRNYLSAILIKIFRQSSHEGEKKTVLLKNVEIVEDALGIMERDYAKKLTLGEIAKRFNFSDVYFNALFKNYTGTTFKKYLQKVRCEKAKELLRNTDETVSSICSGVGYTDVKQFFILFKNLVGQTPTEYRKMYRKKK
jgi:AraC-like DNA-binding protein